MTSARLTQVVAWIGTVGVACALAKWPLIQNALHPYFFGSLVGGRNWLSSHGWHRTAGYYGLVVAHGSELVIALVVGVFCALVVPKRGIFLVVSFVLAYKFFGGIFANISPYSPVEMLHGLLISTCVVLPAGLVGAFWGLVARRYLFKRAQGSQCRNCRYDLTGNTSGVCPECGESIHATPDTR